MCDYSLEHLSSRPAAVADRLVTTNFPNTFTRGFAGSGDGNTAVCLRPGTELAFDRPPKYDNFFWRKKAPGTVARFRQVDIDIRTVHHDALEFADGTIVMLASLRPHQWATVLQLPMTLPTQSMKSPQGAPSEPVDVQMG
jgi:hypothetical protein